MYSYKVIERALARMHNIQHAGWGAFRGRIQHLQRLGMVPASPGKGKRISYTFEDAAKWCFVIELEEFGIDPKNAKNFCDLVWNDLKPIIVDGWEEDAFLFMNPNFVNEDIYRNSPLRYSFVMQSQAKDRVSFFGPVRSMVINASYLRRSLIQALEASARPDDDYPVDPLSREGGAERQTHALALRKSQSNE